MPKSLRDFAAKMRKKQNNFPQYKKGVVNKVVEVVLHDLVYRSPVDTSLSLSNWQVGIDVAITSERSAFYEGVKGSTRGASAEATKSDARDKLEARPVNNRSVHLTNNIDYTADLNEFGTKNVPPGWIQISISVGRSYLEQL
jgi:hypothetical protein